LETTIVPQIVHARIYMKIDKPAGVFFVGFLQAFNCAVFFSQADMDSSKEVRCNVFVFSEFCQILEDLERFFCPSRLSIRMRQRRAHHRATA
jgi:hypothetical protein